MSKNEWERVLERSVMQFALFDSMVSITFTAMVMSGGCLRLNGYIWIPASGLEEINGSQDVSRTELVNT